jgi:hypothetical protein
MVLRYWSSGIAQHVRHAASPIITNPSIPMLKLVGRAIYIVCKLLDQRAAVLARPYVLKDHFAKRHPQIIFTRWAFGRHCRDSSTSEITEVLRDTVTTFLLNALCPRRRVEESSLSESDKIVRV